MATNCKYPHLRKLADSQATSSIHRQLLGGKMDWQAALREDPVDVSRFVIGLDALGLNVSIDGANAEIRCDFILPPSDVTDMWATQYRLTGHPDERYRNLTLLTSIEEVEIRRGRIPAVPIYKVSGFLPLEHGQGDSRIHFRAHNDVYAIGRWDVRIARQMTDEKIKEMVREMIGNGMPEDVIMLMYPDLPWILKPTPVRLVVGSFRQARESAIEAGEFLSAFEDYLTERRLYERDLLYDPWSEWLSEEGEPPALASIE